MSSPVDIAVIGLAGCYAGARNARAYWQNILDKVDCIADADAEWIGPYLDPKNATSRNDRIYTARGGFLRDLAEVDPAEFGVMPSMADGGEPDHLLALKHARDALADAGYLSRPFNRQRAGIVLGRGTYSNRGNANGLMHGLVVDQTMGIIRSLRPDLGEDDLQELRAAFKKQLPPYSGDMVGPLTPNVITGMIANRLDLMGPNFIVDAACASSLIAVELAVKELLSGHSDLMLTGGVQAQVPPQLYIQFCQINALSHGQLRPFQKGCDGTLLGEGVGVMVLKRLADAERDGDRIYAVIKGVGTASDGKAKGLLAPRLEGEVLALKRAYESSGVDPATIGLIEAHGTGTPVGDLTEIQALTTVFGPRSGALPSIALGSVKSMISHCLPASGSAAMIKAVLALHHKVLPPTLCEEPDPALEMERTPFYINNEARPWIHGGPHPRRAGVNAFGFGGINAHVILEEYLKPQRVPPAIMGSPGSAELVMLAADGAGTLADAAERIMARLRQALPPSLAEVAKAAAAQAQGEHRLAIVCDSIADLMTKLQQAVGKLRRSDVAPFRTRSGIYYGCGLAPGRVCFLFPGEGSQYPNMLADLCMHFPRLREWLDFIEETAVSFGSPLRAPVLYPAPTTLSLEQRAQLESKLFDMDVAAELVFSASMGLFTLLDDFGVHADAMLGHSTGENTALTVCGVRRYERREEIAESVRELNRIYRKLLDSGQIARGTLLTIGALRPEARKRLLENPAGMMVAMDNCPNQLVLFGPPQAAQALKLRLSEEGAVFAELPFDRPYHTPLFKPVADAYREHFKGLKFGPGSAQLYSACSVAPFPAEAEAIRELAVAQWQNPVRFVETVERLYADGVRVFIEVGPSGNLTSFVSDILRGRDDVIAVASNSRRRSGMLQLHHMLAQIHSAGVAMRPEALYAHREIADVDLASVPRLPARPKFRLNLRMPTMVVPEGWTPASQKDVRTAASSAAAQAAPTVVSIERGSHPAPAANDVATAAPAAPPAAATAVSAQAAAPAVVDPRTLAVQSHFGLMQEFLESQARIFAGFGLGAVPAAAATSATAPVAPGSVTPTGIAADYPLLGQITEQTADRQVSERVFDCDTDLFLRDHCIGVHPSARRPELLAMPCIPFTFSMEILAQAAARLTGGSLKVIRIEDSRGSRWLNLDEGTLRLRVVAERINTRPGMERVQVRIFQPAASGKGLALSVFEGIVLLAQAHPEAPAPIKWRAQQEHGVRNNPNGELYRHGMFHGPRLQGVTRLRRWASEAMEAELTTIPTHDYFSFTQQPLFRTDAALLDAAGQLTAYWLTEKHGWNNACFPFHVANYTQYRDPLPAGARLVCLGELRLGDEQRLEARFDLLDEQGRLVARATGWESRTFAMPEILYRFRLDPLRERITRSWNEAGGSAADLQVCRAEWLPEGFLDQAWGLWKRVVATMVLCAPERRSFHQLPASGPQREVWLMGRIAAKDAVRDWALQTLRVQLAPADIEIAASASGQPYVAGCVGLPPGTPLPSISISHSERCSIGVCGSPALQVGIDSRHLAHADNPDDLIRTGFSAAEAQQFLGALPEGERRRAAVALWCAKQAAARAAGGNLEERPQDWTVFAANLDRRGGSPGARVRHGAHEYAVHLHFSQDEIFALCRVEPGLATSLQIRA